MRRSKTQSVDSLGSPLQSDATVAHGMLAPLDMRRLKGLCSFSDSAGTSRTGPQDDSMPVYPMGYGYNENWVSCMKREEALKRLREHQAELGALGVQSLTLFGSAARDEMGPGSDVDIVVEFARPVGFFAFLDVKEQLEKLLGRPVDLVTRKALHPKLRDAILREAVHAR